MSGRPRASTSIAMRRSPAGLVGDGKGRRGRPETLDSLEARFQFRRRIRDERRERRPGSLEALGQPFHHRQAIHERSDQRRRLCCSRSPSRPDHFQQRDQLGRAPADADDRGGLRLQFRRPLADGIASQSGMKARDESARPLRIASRIQGSSASLAAIFARASSAAGSFAAAIAQRDRRVEAHTDGGVTGQLDEGRCGKQSLVNSCFQSRPPLARRARAGRGEDRARHRSGLGFIDRAVPAAASDPEGVQPRQRIGLVLERHRSRSCATAGSSRSAWLVT